MPTFQELLTLKMEALDLQNHPKYKEFMASAPTSAPAAVVAPDAPDASEDAPAAAVPAAHPAAPLWEPSMTKAELLAIAGQLGVTSVTASNTKAEILSTLDALL